MTTKTLTTTILTALTTASLLLSARADITSGLMGYWKFTDGSGSATAADASGNGNNGTLTGFSDTTYNNMWTTSADPNNGWPYALLFQGSGSGNYVSVADSPTLDSITGTTKKFTLAAWVNLSVACPANPGAAIICKGSGSGGEAWVLDIYNKHFRVFVRKDGSTTMNVESTFTPNAGTWYHVVGTYDSSASANREVLYINGVANANSGSGNVTTILANTHVVSIGNRQSGTTTYNLPFPGTIDEVRIYNRALSASEVSQLYTYKAFPVVNKGVGSWTGQTGSGGNATLDTTSLNFCTNQWTAPLGTADNLADLLSVESANTLPLGCALADFYYSNGIPVFVQSTNLTIAPGGVALGTANGPGTLTSLNAWSTYTLTSPDGIGLMDGPNPTSLVQGGTGTLILMGTNTFTGNVTINSGTLQLGSGSTTIGQELGTGTSMTDNGALVFNGTNTSLGFDKTISGSGSVTYLGPGTLTLNSANTYSGGTTLSNASVVAASLNDGASTLGTGPVALKGATLLYTGAGDSTVRQISAPGGSTNTIDVPSGILLELSGQVSRNGGTGTFIVNKTSAGTLQLSGSGDNSYLGVNIVAGTVILNKTAHAAIGGPTTVGAGASLQLANNGYAGEIYSGNTAPITVSSGGTFDLNGQNSTVYTLSLSGSGIGGAGAVANSASGTISTLTCPITLAADTTMGGAGSIALAKMINGSGKLTYSGSGTLTLGTANIYTGGTEVTSGTLAATNANVIPDNITISGIGTLDITISNAVPGNVTLTGTGVLQLDDPSALSSAATLTLPGSPANNTVYLNFSGTNTIAALVIGSTVQPAGTYGAVGSSAVNQSAIFNSLGLGVLNVSGQPYWDPGLTAASPGSGGTSNWDTTTGNWFTGSTDMAWPTDALAVFAGTAGTVTLAANVNADGLTFATAGYTITNTDGISVLTLDNNNPTITVPAGTTTIACTLAESGTGPVTINGPGTLILTGTNTFAGGTTLNGATLKVNTIADANCALGPSGTMTMQGGSALSYIGADPGATARNIIANGPATTTIDVPNGTLTLSGQVRAGIGTIAPNYTKTGVGTLVLGGSTDNSGLAMAINQGTLVITKTSAGTVHGLGGGTSTVASGAELQLGGSGGQVLYNGCVLSVASGGVFDLAGQTTCMSTLTNSGTGFGGGALINSVAGTTSYLTNGGSGVILAGPTTVGGVGGITLMNGVNGTGPLTYAGTATLTLNAADTFSGGLIVNAGGTVQLNNVSGAGTGDVTDNGTLTLNSGSGNWTNRTTGGSSSIVAINLATGNFWLLDDLSGFSGTFNVNAGMTGTPQLVVGNSTNYSIAINGSATWNINTNACVDFNGSQVNPARVNLYGAALATDAFGALRLDASTQSGDVVLYGNSSIGNGQASPSTIRGVIRESGGSYGFTKMGNNANQILVLSGTNTYTGPTTISAGVLAIGGAGQLGSGNYVTNLTNNAIFNYASSAAQTLSGVVSGTGTLMQSGPGLLTLTGANTFTGNLLITNNGSTLAISGSGCLGAATATNYAGAISNYGTFNYASSAAQTLSGVISGTGALVQSGSGTLTLSGVNTYTGGTVLTNGSTLALASGGSINTTPSISIAAGATLDASAYSTYSMLSGITLSASGTGTTPGSTAATLKGATSSGATITLAGPLALTFNPQTFTGDATHPALYVSQIAQGQLVLSGSTITVNNAGASPLGVGTYSLIQVAPGGTISVGTPTVTVTGKGLAAGTAASLSVSGGSVNLVVVTTVVPVPGINSVALSGTDLIFSGTNGSSGATYYVLTSTNVALPLSQWTPVATNSFSPTGTFSVTNAVGTNPRQFFSIEIPQAGH